MSRAVSSNEVSLPVASKLLSICPPSLLKHLQNKADSLSWRIEESKLHNMTRLIDDILKFTEQKNINDEKAVRRHIFESSEKVIKTLLLNENLMDAYENHRIEVKTLVEMHDDLRIQNKRIFDEITSHHESLVAEGYDTGVGVDVSLKKYKNAAHEMGKKEWVVLSNAWMESTAYNFFYETGAQRAYLKLLQHRSLFERGVPLSADDHKRFREVTNNVLFSAADVEQQKAGIQKPRLLDVGSCYNPFKTSKHANMFDVTGIDLCPAVDSVYTCDFLTIQVGDPTSQPVFDEANSNILLTYPANSFEVVTMSLVLNYLPSPSHRELMIENARKLLIAPCESHSPSDIELPTSPHRSGLLLIVEKISIFDWKSNQRVEPRAKSSGASSSEAAPSRHEWIRCICDIGFELVTYQTNVYAGHHVHLFAFRVVPLPPRVDSAETVSGTGSNHGGADRPRMRIKADVKVMSELSRV